MATTTTAARSTALDKRKYEIACKLDSHSFTTRQGVLVQLQAGQLDLAGAISAGKYPRDMIHLWAHALTRVSPALVDHVAKYGIPRSWDLRSEQTHAPSTSPPNDLARTTARSPPRHNDVHMLSPIVATTPHNAAGQKRVRFATAVDRSAWITPPKATFVYNKQHWVQGSNLASPDDDVVGSVQGTLTHSLETSTVYTASPVREANDRTPTRILHERPSAPSSLESVWQEMNSALERLSSSPICASPLLPDKTLADPDLDSEPTLIDLELGKGSAELPIVREDVEVERQQSIKHDDPIEAAALDRPQRAQTPEQQVAIDVALDTPLTPAQQTMSSMFSCIMNDENESPVDLMAAFTRDLITFVDEDVAGCSQTSVELPLDLASSHVAQEQTTVQVDLTLKMSVPDRTPCGRQDAPSPPASPVKTETDGLADQEQVLLGLTGPSMASRAAVLPTRTSSADCLAPRVSFKIDLPVSPSQRRHRTWTSSPSSGSPQVNSIQDYSVTAAPAMIVATGSDEQASEALVSDGSDSDHRAIAPLSGSVDTPPEFRSSVSRQDTKPEGAVWPILDSGKAAFDDDQDVDASPVRPLKRKRERSGSSSFRNKLRVPDSDEDFAEHTSATDRLADTIPKTLYEPDAGTVADPDRLDARVKSVPPSSPDVLLRGDPIFSRESIAEPKLRNRPRRTRRTTENWWDVNRALKSIELQKQAWKQPTVTPSVGETIVSRKSHRGPDACKSCQRRSSRNGKGCLRSDDGGDRSSSPDPLAV
ncbi:hypothetical protein OIV83_003007 [Microbotryomycetes sp. JL201]|nr:hypothetical protein OIV83_003007 [Microbotryomycetes sp. JL201]